MFRAIRTDNILVVDDDTLMRPSLAVELEYASRRMGGASSVEQAMALIQVCPPELIFLTARRTRLDPVLSLELENGHGVKPFDLAMLFVRVKAGIVARLGSAAARWRRILVLDAFGVGVLLLMLAAPQPTRWVQNVPSGEMVWGWLTHLVFDPTTTFNALLSQAMPTWLNLGEQMDALTTLAIMVLAMASVAGLTQLLGRAGQTHPNESNAARAPSVGRVQL